MVACMLMTVDDVIRELGGATQVARILSVGVPAVSNAKKAGRFPHRWRMRIYEEADRRGLRIAPELIGRSEH